MLKPVRIGVVGGGVYGTQMLKCFAAQQARGRVELKAVTDLDENILASHARTFNITGFTSYEEMMDQAGLDAVAVATPDHLHAPVITQAAERGLHVLSQKPLDVSVSRTLDLIRFCSEAGVLLYVDFHKRFDPAHIRLREDVRTGRLGKLQYGSVHMEDKITVPSEWLRSWAAASSPSWFLGVHFYDLVSWLTGLEPVRLLATGHKGKLESMGLDGAWDSIQVAVEYESGFSMNYDLSWILPKTFPSIVNQGIRLVGQEGVSEVDSQDRGYFAAYQGDETASVVNPFGALEYAHPVLGSLAEGYTFYSMAYFIDILEGLASGRSLEDLDTSYPDGESALVSTRVGAAVDDSLKCGERVPVAPRSQPT